MGTTSRRTAATRSPGPTRGLQVEVGKGRMMTSHGNPTVLLLLISAGAGAAVTTATLTAITAQWWRWMTAPGPAGPERVSSARKCQGSVGSRHGPKERSVIGGDSRLDSVRRVAFQVRTVSGSHRVMRPKRRSGLGIWSRAMYARTVAVEVPRKVATSPVVHQSSARDCSC